jgi:hypothetical protein
MRSLSLGHSERGGQCQSESPRLEFCEAEEGGSSDLSRNNKSHPVRDLAQIREGMINLSLQ